MNITNFRKNVFSMLETTAKYNQPLNIATKEGNVIVISEEDYRSMLETLYLSSMPKVKESIINAGNADDSEFIDEKDVNW